MTETRFHVGSRVLAVSLICLGTAILCAATRPGPDYDHYLGWARAFLNGDIFELGGLVLSPSGVPLSLWSHGTGLIFALTNLVVGDSNAAWRGAIAAGWLASLLFWWAMFRLLQRASGGELPLTLFGLGAAFIGTHAGFYSHTHGSETFGYAFGAILAVVVTSGHTMRIREVFAGGSAAALAVSIRPHLAIYALPALVILCIRVVKARFDSGLGRTGLAVGWLAASALIGILQVLLVNRWMTGELAHSPYAFGNGEFQSIDLTKPELSAILIHPWHGLIAYHPLYAICMAALAAIILRAKSRQERLVWLAIGALVVFQLYLQAAWFFWWLGTATLGMRGMGVTAVLLVPALIYALRNDRHAHVRRRRVWVVLTVAACLWSYLLLLQGETSFYKYGEMLEAQSGQLRTLMQPRSGLILLGSLIASATALRGTILRTGSADSDPVVNVSAGLLLGLSGAYLALQLVSGLFQRTAFALLLAVLAAAAILVGYPALGQFFEKRKVRLDPGELIATGTGWAVVTVFLAAIPLFAGLAVQTERWIAADRPSPRPMECTSGVLWDEIRESYYEYERVTGFEDRKAELKEFLTETGGSECPSLALPSAAQSLGFLPLNSDPN